jgi:hypothetical protein
MAEKLRWIMRQLGHVVSESDQETENLLRCLTTGFFMNAAQKQADGSYVVISTRESVHLHPSSILNHIFPNWVIFDEVTSLGSQSGKTYIRRVSEIEVDWLMELAP